MAWNEPGDDKDPWKRDGDKQKPPELDEVVRKLQKRFGAVLGGGQGSSDVPPVPAGVKFLLLAAILLAALFASRFTVDAGSIGVVQRFGEFQREAEPGWNWKIPWVDRVDIVQVDLSQEFDSENEMLTGDANIISISINLQYRHAGAKDFVFNVRDPDSTLQEVTDAAIRAIVGKYDIEYIQRQGREQVASETKVLIQKTLDSYGTGILVDAVNLRKTEFPSPVQEAAQDVIRADRDKERYILQAESYTNDLIPRARGEAAREVENARAYEQKLVNDATGEANRFTALLLQYEAAPDVTRERLYIEAVEDVLGSTSKVLMDTEGSGNLVYLPVDKLMENSRRQPQTSNNRDDTIPKSMTGASALETGESAASGTQPQQPDRSRSRDR